MRYELDIAVAYLCVLTLIWYVASWAVPRLFHAAVAAIVQRIEPREDGHTRKPSRSAEPEQLTGDWWGPTHHSQ